MGARRRRPTRAKLGAFVNFTFDGPARCVTPCCRKACRPESKGPDKARFFTALGFAPGRWEELAEALRLQHLTQDGQLAGPTVQGRQFTIRAILNGPTGQSAFVISVWFIPAGGEVPRFVTAYPGDGL